MTHRPLLDRPLHDAAARRARILTHPTLKLVLRNSKPSCYGSAKPSPVSPLNLPRSDVAARLDALRRRDADLAALIESLLNRFLEDTAE